MIPSQLVVDTEHSMADMIEIDVGSFLRINPFYSMGRGKNKFATISSILQRSGTAAKLNILDTDASGNLRTATAMPSNGHS